MSVEKMQMLNIIGHIEDLHDISKELVLLECIHVVNALNEIDCNNFAICTSEKNADALVEMCFIKPYTENTDYTETENRLISLMEIFDINPQIHYDFIKQSFNSKDMVSIIDNIYAKVENHSKKIIELEKELSVLEGIEVNIDYLTDINIELNVLKHLAFFNFRIGRLSKDNMAKLKSNFENIPAIIYRIKSLENSEVIISIAPKSLEIELNRILNSLNYEEILIPEDIAGTPENIITEIMNKKKQISHEIKILKEDINALKQIYGHDIEKAYSSFELYENIQRFNKEIALSNDFFYMSGWIPIKRKKTLEEKLKPYMNRTQIFYKDTDNVVKNISPPTKLSNNRIVRPFESFVNMYGIPSYNELDPTMFLGISYMILFGAMFADLGQGFVLFLLGQILSRLKSRPNLGGVLSRIGLSSMAFGILFGSVFGYDNIFPAVLVSPMQNIQTMLISAVILGIVLITISYIFNIVNTLKHKDIEEGIFGKNGITGLLFYWLLLINIVYYLFNNRTALPIPVLIFMFMLIITLMITKHPLTNWLRNKRPLYSERKIDYYIEESFGFFETLLGFLSNTISFIRVGAFALTHVGLFIAFSTIAQMINNQFGGFLMIIIGNIVIIGLEGLIVFIQGLRLEYYEIFTKFYQGNGNLYKPVSIDYNKKPFKYKSRHMPLHMTLKSLLLNLLR